MDEMHSFIRAFEGSCQSESYKGRSICGESQQLDRIVEVR